MAGSRLGSGHTDVEGGDCIARGAHIAARQIYASAQGEMIDGKTWNLIHITMR